MGRSTSQEIDTPTLTPTIDVIAVFMNELVADYRSEKTYETRDGRICHPCVRYKVLPMRVDGPPSHPPVPAVK